MTTWAGGVATSVVVAVLGAAAVYGVHAVLSRPQRPDLSGPPVKIEQIEVTSLNDDLLSASVDRSAPPNIYGHGFVPAVGITALIHATGNRSGLVRIVDIHVLKSCSAPLRGTLVFLPPQGALGTLGIGFDLDSRDPVARDIPGVTYGLQTLGASYFASHEYDLKLGEPITLALTAQTAQHYCTFKFELDLLVNGSPVTQIVDDHGKPFAASAEYEVATEGKGTAPDFPLYGALYVSQFTLNPCASSGRLVAENPRTWRQPTSYKALPKTGCTAASSGVGGS